MGVFRNAFVGAAGNAAFVIVMLLVGAPLLLWGLKLREDPKASKGMAWGLIVIGGLICVVALPSLLVAAAVSD
jgi:hypothetical protein